jgi:hypothetical protein
LENAPGPGPWSCCRFRGVEYWGGAEPYLASLAEPRGKLGHRLVPNEIVELATSESRGHAADLAVLHRRG